MADLHNGLPPRLDVDTLAGGGYWKIEAAQNIKGWLEVALRGTSAELGNIPIIY